MMPQFADARLKRVDWENFARGLALFALGLGKKVLIADTIAPWANAGFAHAHSLSFLDGWITMLAYVMQLVFDFSGYTDMALGAALMLNIKLPVNFDSPYRSADIQEFWRRWHITLSRFLRDYLYVPLGVNRRGPVRRYANLMTTMLLGGLWHGAGWNFAIWGGLHGLYLCVNHAWQRIAGEAPARTRAGRFLSAALTFVAVNVAWVFFRAPTPAIGHDVLLGMAGGFGVGLPAALVTPLAPLRHFADAAGIELFFGGGRQFVMTWTWVALAGVLAFTAPNTQEIARRFAPALGVSAIGLRQRCQLRFDWRWAVGLGVLASASLLSLSSPTEFLYFQF
jgi:D-alanyl-lipoteichoic acid acyltransferase DltB (MBOAT superfamily)